jgi:DNA (cytosine-5)-methyltransferase 1
VAFNARQDVIQYGDQSGPLDTDGHTIAVQSALCVRRLTPLECCRLQGFSDDYLDISYRGKPAADGPRYKALGNSMAVPVMRWIGERIAAVKAIEVQEVAA